MLVFILHMYILLYSAAEGTLPSFQSVLRGTPSRKKRYHGVKYGLIVLYNSFIPKYIFRKRFYIIVPVISTLLSRLYKYLLIARLYFHCGILHWADI